MTAVEIFAQLNADSGAFDVTGDSNQDEYNLRKYLTDDLVEFEGDFSLLLEAWTKGEKEPEGVREEEDEPAKRPYTHPKMQSGAAFDTMSKGAISIKKAAAIAVAALIDRIAMAHAFPDDLSPAIYGGGGGLYAATSMVASIGKGIAENSSDWQAIAWAAWIILLHIALAFVLWQRFGPRWTCRRRRASIDAAVQVNTLPNVATLTVDGLRHEAKCLGLRSNGLRAELELRVGNELISRSGDML